jgi:ABC-type branched-subunit amino acid transport system substrate-binding protein
MRHLKANLLKTIAAAAVIAAVSQPALADSSPVVFVAAIIQSGPFKVTDAQNLAGIQFAVAQINAAGGVAGHPVKLDVIDTELNAAATKRKVTDEILNHDAKIIIGASGSDVLKALVAVGQQYQVPVLAFAGEADDMTGAKFQPALFRVAANTSMHAAAIVYAMKQDYPNTQKVFLLNQDYAFGHESETGFKAALQRLDPGVQIVGSVFHPRGAADFSPYLQQIQASGADFVLTSDWGADLIKLLNQAISFGLKPRVGGTFLADPEILKGVGTGAIGDIGADVFQPTINTAEARDFDAKFHAANATGGTPWATASVGKSYIATELAAEAINQAGSTDFGKIEKALEGLKYSSIAGPLVIRACDHQVQIGEATGEVVAANNNPYAFPFIGPALIAPLSAIEVAPAATGNPRCLAGTN